MIVLSIITYVSEKEMTCDSFSRQTTSTQPAFENNGFSEYCSKS